MLPTMLLLCTFLVAATYKKCAVQGFDVASVIQMEFTNSLLLLGKGDLLSRGNSGWRSCPDAKETHVTRDMAFHQKEPASFPGLSSP